MNSIKQYLEEYFAYTIGFSQAILNEDNYYQWVVVEIIAQCQKLAILFLNNVVVSLLSNKSDSITYEPFIEYPNFQTISKVIVPSVYIIDNLNINVLILAQCVVMILLFFPLLMNFYHLMWEKLQFGRIRYRTSSIEESENLNFSINILNRSYNMHNFIEHFLQKQFAGSNNGQWADQERYIQAISLNLYPHVFLIPVLYWILIVWLLIIKTNLYSEIQYVFLIVLNSFTTFGSILLLSFSMLVQRSYSIKDSNHLRLIQSTWFNFSQVLKLIPVFIQFVYFIQQDYFELKSSILLPATQVCILIIVIGDLIDNFISYPFVMQYKQYTILIALPTTICMAICLLTQQTELQMICICIFCVPISSKLLINFQQFRNTQILCDSLYQERKRPPALKIVRTGMLQEEEQPFVIERELNAQKECQIEYLQNQNFKYFIHYLRLVDLMDINEQQSFEKGSSIIDINKSKFLISVIILLKSHIIQCENMYCYCKGFRGERRRIIEKNYHQLDMKIYDDFEKYNLLLSVDLIKRYLRYYAKLIFEIEKNKSSLNLCRITQLIQYLSESEECYQTLLLIMEYKTKHQKNQSLMYHVIMTYMTSFGKYQILSRLQFNVQLTEIEATLQYKDYRVTEIRRDKIIELIFKTLEAKQEFMKNLSQNKYDYEGFQNLIEKQIDVNQRTCHKIESFNIFSSSRTSILVQMLYCFEVTNDFYTFLKLKSKLKTKQYKFFEYPAEFRNSNQSYEVCYVKANVARHAKKGKISRGEIIQYSNNTPELFGYTQRQFSDEISTIHQLVTHHLKTIHDQLMEIFLLTNRPSLLRKKRPILVLRKNKDLMFAEMFVDLCFNIAEETFPVYCFLRKLTSAGDYEHIKGHIVLNDQMRIEGISTMALDEFKLKNSTRYLNKKIQKFIPNFQRYYDRLMISYKNFTTLEATLKKNLSTAECFEYKQQELLLNHFSFFVDNVAFKVPRNDGVDSYILECEITMTLGDIHGKEYKSYLIQIQKINYQETSGTKVLPSKYEYLSSYQNEVSQSSMQPSESDIMIVNNEKEDSEHSLKMENYFFNFQSNFQSPDNTKGDILLSDRIPEQQPISLKNQQQLPELNNEEIVENNEGENQQDFYEASKAKKSIGIDEIEVDLQQKLNNSVDFQLNTNSSYAQNQTVSNIIYKTSLFQRFSSKSYLPRIFVLMLILDFINFAMVLIIAHVPTYLFQTQLEKSTQIVGIFEAFVTTDYAQNTMIALGLQYNTNLNETNQQDLYAILLENTNNYVIKYQRYLDDSIVKQTLSGITLFYFDTVFKSMYEISAWSELFYVSYMQKELQQFNYLEDQQNYDFNVSINTLIQSYKVHEEAYKKITKSFYSNIVLDFIFLKRQLLIILLVFVCFEIFIGMIYYLFYTYYFRLNNKILRTCEQVGIKSLQNEQIRCFALINEYPRYYDLDLYSYSFLLKDKLMISNALQLMKSKKASIRFQSHLQQNETKKQLFIKDERSLFSRFLFTTSMIGIVFSLIYFIIIQQNNNTEIYNLNQQLVLFNSYITYTEQFSVMVFADSVLQYQNSLVASDDFDQQVIDQYSKILSSSQGQVKTLTESLLYESNTNSYDLLTSLVVNVCTMVNDQSVCPTLINGKLSEGLIYSIQYFSNKVQENMDSNYSGSGITTQPDDLMALNIIVTSINQLIKMARVDLVSNINNLINDRLVTVAVFTVIYVIQQFINTYITQKYLRRRLYNARQLPNILPPQSVYGEDSFMKTLVFIEKIYDNFIQ